ncbi:MAG: hypothetical protein AAFR46_09950, partial [Pseudomonadota bacterium]
AAVPVLNGARQTVDATVIRGLHLFEALLTGLTEDGALAACQSLRATKLPCRPHPVVKDG